MLTFKVPRLAKCFDCEKITLQVPDHMAEYLKKRSQHGCSITLGSGLLFFTLFSMAHSVICGHSSFQSTPLPGNQEPRDC